MYFLGEKKQGRRNSLSCREVSSGRAAKIELPRDLIKVACITDDFTALHSSFRRNFIVRVCYIYIYSAFSERRRTNIYLCTGARLAPTSTSIEVPNLMEYNHGDKRKCERGLLSNTNRKYQVHRENVF